MTQLNGIPRNSDRENLVKEMIAENEFILKLVGSIPANMYFNQGMTDKINKQKHAIMDKKAEALKRSSSNKMDLSTKNKHKRARLDPACQKSVLQVHEELSKRKQRKKKIAKKNTELNSNRATNIEELRSRLQERISEFQSKRKVTDQVGQEEKRLKRKEQKLKKKKAVITKVNEVGMQTKKPRMENNPVKETDSTPKAKFNKDGKLLYGKLDFAGDDVNENKKKAEYAGKDFKNLLKKAEKNKEKIASLREKDPQKAVQIEEKEKWKKAIMRSENMKVKDDPELLKKSLKKQEKIKEKRAKTWKDREEHVETQLKRRQEKRTRNIKKRKDDKLQNKIKKAKKKGRIVITN